MIVSFSRPIVLVLAAAAAIFVAIAVVSTRTAPDTYPVADTATTSLYALRAARGELTTGSYSRFGWNHPGPLLYQLLAGPYAASGRREIAIKWTALAINLIACSTLLAMLWRRSPVLTLAVALALTPLLWREQRLLFFAWNPFVPVLALAAAMAAAADVAAGDPVRLSRAGLLAVVVLLSFCVQAHAGLAMPAVPVALLTIAGVWIAWRRSDGVTRRGLAGALLLAVAVAALLWATPLAGELRESPANLRSTAAFLVEPDQPRATWARAAEAAAYMALGPLLPMWTLQFVEIPPMLPTWLPWAFGMLIGAVAWSGVAAHRRGDRFDALFAGLCAILSVVVVVAARGVVGPMSDYLLLWATGVGALDLGVVGAALVGRSGRIRAAATRAHRPLAIACLLAWMVIGGARLTGKHAEQARDTTLRALSIDLQNYCQANGVERPLLLFAPGETWAQAVGIVLQFAKADRPIAVDDSAISIVGRPFARNGREDGEFYLMPVASSILPPDTGRVAWVTTRGGYRIIRVRLADSD